MIRRRPSTTPALGNVVLSYQYAVRHAGKEWSGILYTQPAARILHPELPEDELASFPERIPFSVLLGQAIMQGKADGHISKWPKHADRDSALVPR